MRLAVRRDARCPRARPWGVVDVDSSRLVSTHATRRRADSALIRVTLRVERTKNADNARYVKLRTDSVIRNTESVARKASPLVEHRRGHLVGHADAAAILDTATEDQVRAAFMQAVARLQVSAEGQRLLVGLFGGDVTATLNALDWDGWSEALESMKERLAQRAEAAAVAEVVAIAPGLTVQFGGTMAKAADRAAAGVGEHIVGIDDRTRAAVREIIRGGLRAGTSIPDLTHEIANTVGLEPGSARALNRYEKQLIADGFEPARIRLLVTAQRDRYLLDRGRTVARTETMWAANQGRLDGYAYAAAQGAIGTDARKQWVLSAGACPLCLDMAGEEVGLADDFSSGGNAPPYHPNCRCTTILSDLGTIPDEPPSPTV